MRRLRLCWRRVAHFVVLLTLSMMIQASIYLFWRTPWFVGTLLAVPVVVPAAFVLTVWLDVAGRHATTILAIPTNGSDGDVAELIAQWRQPELGPDDRLIEATIVRLDGSRERIVVVRRTGNEIEGFNRPIVLTPGAHLTYR